MKPRVLVRAACVLLAMVIVASALALTTGPVHKVIPTVPTPGSGTSAQSGAVTGAPGTGATGAVGIGRPAYDARALQGPSQELSGTVEWVRASVVPSCLGCGLDVGGGKVAAVVTSDPGAEALMMAAFMAQKFVTVTASKLSAPPPGFGPYTWYVIQSISAGR